MNRFAFAHFFFHHMHNQFSFPRTTIVVGLQLINLQRTSISPSPYRTCVCLSGLLCVSGTYYMGSCMKTPSSNLPCDVLFDLWAALSTTFDSLFLSCNYNCCTHSIPECLFSLLSIYTVCPRRERPHRKKNTLYWTILTWSSHFMCVEG